MIQAAFVETDLDSLPQWRTIRSALEAAKLHLLKAGAIFRRDDRDEPTFVLRFRVQEGDKRRYKSIRLGDQLCADAAGELIQRWREEANPRAALMAEAATTMKLVAAARGYSGRARKRLLAATATALASPVEGFLFMRTFEHREPRIRTGKRPGRPRKRSLW